MNSKPPYCSLILLALLLVTAHTVCYDYWNGDTLPTTNASSYCRSLIIWPVSDLVLNDSESRDARAIQYYQDIYNNSYSVGEVDLECLGVLQYTACAATYPTCANDDDSVETVCSWLCQLMALRCGTDSQLYKDACVIGTVAPTHCSQEHALLLTLLPLLLLALVTVI